MTEQTNLVPKRRFKEFQNTYAWEQRKLGEVTKITMGQSPNGENYTNNPDDYILVQGNADMKNGQVVPRVWTTQITKTADVNDLIMSVRAPVGEVGKTAYSVVIGRGVAAIKGNEFIFQSLKRMNSNGYWKQFSAGSTFDSINSNDLSNAAVSIADDDEQEKIGVFFQHLDNLITLHQRKLEKMKALKSAYLSEMFPAEGEREPKRRFEGFTHTHAWEQRKFNDLIQKLTGGASVKPEDYQENGVRTIPKGAVNSSGVADLSGSKHITHAFFEKNISSKVSTGDLVTSLRDLVPTAPNMGRIVRINGNKEVFLMPQGVYRIELRNGVDEDFIIAFSNSDKYRKIISEEKNGSTQVHIRNSEFLNIEIQTPNYEEQKKIGTFFKQLDSTIALHQRKLEKLQNIKKAYLNEMFI